MRDPKGSATACGHDVSRSVVTPDQSVTEVCDRASRVGRCAGSFASRWLRRPWFQGAPIRLLSMSSVRRRLSNWTRQMVIDQFFLQPRALSRKL